MDEQLSWRARLAKSNINITNIDYDHQTVYFDFSYRPYPGAAQRWSKSFAWYEEPVDWSHFADALRLKVLELRKELEG